MPAVPSDNNAYGLLILFLRAFLMARACRHAELPGLWDFWVSSIVYAPVSNVISSLQPSVSFCACAKVLRAGSLPAFSFFTTGSYYRFLCY